MVRRIGKVFYIRLYLRYYNAIKNRQQPNRKGSDDMKTVKKLEAMLSEYYETFKH